MNSFISLANLVKKSGYRGYESDGLLGSKFLSAISFCSLFIERVFVQTGKLLPLNIRPLIGIGKLESAKANGFFAKGYLYAFKASNYGKFCRKSLNC